MNTSYDDSNGEVASSSSNPVQIVRSAVKGRSTIHGSSYHLRLAMIIILRAYRTYQLDNAFHFTAAMEVSAAGKFDDMLYHYLSPRLGTGTFVIQAKHKQHTARDGNAPKKNTVIESSNILELNKETTLTEDMLLDARDSNTSFSIPMYFMSFLEVEKELPNDARYVLCTNAALHKNIISYCKEINPQEDYSLQFCDDIGATCYQFDWDKRFSALLDTLRDSCLAKLAKEFAKNIFGEKVIKFNGILFNTFFNLINVCIEPLEQEISDPSVGVFKLTEDFSGAVPTTSPSTSTEKFRKAFEQELESLLKKKKTPENGPEKTTDEVKIKIDRDSFMSARNTQDLEIFGKFDQKVREFYSKFLLLCNSSNEEHLRTQAMALLPQWCDAKRGTVFDKMQGILFDAMKSVKPLSLDLKYLQKCFWNIDLNANICDLMNSSKESIMSIHKKHPHIEVSAERIKASKLFAFLQSNSDAKIHEFYSTLDLTVSARILDQTILLLQYEAIFVDSRKYLKQQDMLNTLDDLLSYLQDVNHPTIKAITILGNSDHESNDEIKKMSKKYRQKIVIVEKMSGSLANGKSFERVLVKDLSGEASNKLYKHRDLTMFGINMSLRRIVEECDQLSFLLDLLELCEQTKEIGHNLNKHNYEKIKHWYIHRHFVPYKEKEKRENANDLEYLSATEIQNVLAINDEDPDPPGLQDSDSGKICIFLNEAGLGKSTYFTWLAWRLTTTDPSLFVIKFITMEYSTDSERLIDSVVQNLDDTEIVRLLYRYIHLALFVPSIHKRTIKETNEIRSQADRCANILTVSKGQIALDETKTNVLSVKELMALRLFREKYNEHKIILILDGFDEIAPCCKDVVMNCFVQFAHLEGVRCLYFSSRPYGFGEDLKKTFVQCRLLQLTTLSRSDHVLLLHKFLLSNVSEYLQCESNYWVHVLTMLHTIVVDTLGDLINVPMMLNLGLTMLLPEIVQRMDFASQTIPSHKGRIKRLDRLQLVKEFIDKKLTIFVTNKIGTTDSAASTVAAKSNKERMHKLIKKQHMLLALHVIFDSNCRNKLLSSEERDEAGKCIKNVSKFHQVVGIVEQVQDGVPQFIHQTFAEYYAACWLVQNRDRLSNEGIFRSPTFWTETGQGVQEFFNQLIPKEDK